METQVKYFTGLVMLTGCWLQGLCAPVVYFNRDDFNISSFKCGDRCGTTDVTCSQDSLDFYRYLTLSDDQKYLYVGAMNNLFKLNATDLTCVNQTSLHLNDSVINMCALQGKRKTPDCQNHVRIVIQNEDNLTVCSTGSYAPKTYRFDATTLSKDNSHTPKSSDILCPYDPFDNITSIKIQIGNPENITASYLGVYTDFIKSAPIIFRSEFKSKTRTYDQKGTDTEDFNWLYSPQFVGSFDVDKEVFFFFREKSIEADDSGLKIYSRVAKVCKKDIGSTLAAPRMWLSFQKARLNCSLPGENPYYFDDIYDVYQSGDLFFALFFKQGAGLNSSAICVFTKDQIHKVFKGPFQHKENGIWRKVSDQIQAKKRLDNCDLYDASGEFNSTSRSKFQLMYNSVDAKYHRPIFYQPGIQLTRLVVTDSMKGARNIYAASSDGEIHNIFMKYDMKNNMHTVKTSVYSPFAPNRFPIWNLKKLGNSLILGTDYSVTKISLDVCSNITKIDTCVQNTECKWCHISHCQHSSTQVENTCVDYTAVDANKHIYKTLKDLKFLKVTKEERDSITGLMVSLHINTHLSLDHSVEWHHKKKVLTDDPSRYIKAADGTLVIKSVQPSDRGLYEAYIDNFLLTEVNLEAIQSGDKDELMTKWEQEFITWSGTFKKWRNCNSDQLDSCSREP